MKTHEPQPRGNTGRRRTLIRPGLPSRWVSNEGPRRAPGERERAPSPLPPSLPSHQTAQPARPESQEPTRLPHADHGRRRPFFTSTTGASLSFSRSTAASGPGVRPPRLPPPPVSQTPAPRVCSRRCEST